MFKNDFINSDKTRMKIVCKDKSINVNENLFKYSDYFLNMEGTGDYTIPYKSKYVEVIFYLLDKKSRKIIELPKLLNIKQFMKIYELYDFLLIRKDTCKYLNFLLKHKCFLKYSDPKFSDWFKKKINKPEILTLCCNINKFDVDEKITGYRFVDFFLKRLKEIYTLEYLHYEENFLQISIESICFVFYIKNIPFSVPTIIIDNYKIHYLIGDSFCPSSGFAATVADFFSDRL